MSILPVRYGASTASLPRINSQAAPITLGRTTFATSGRCGGHPAHKFT